MGKRNIMFGARKGITPVIALVLLLMMTVAAAGMAYVWFMDVQEETQDTVRDSLSQRTDQMAGAVVVDAVYETGVAGSTDIIVRNTGSLTYAADVSVFLGPEPCGDATVNAPGDSAVVSCAVSIDVDGIVIRAIPPQGAAVTVTCNLKGTGNNEYCLL